MAPRSEAERRERQEAWRDADRGAGMLAEFVAAPLAWGGIGWALDSYLFHRPPWALIGGLVLGFVLGTYLLFVRTQEDARAELERRADRR